MPLTSRQAYRIVRLNQGADLDEVKTSFRKLAFELHPDLHPDDP
ncbi:MAG: DnaJ domain-containing protein, partial [Desulfovibrionaceae bacterium]